jgi:hypothetical protein
MARVGDLCAIEKIPGRESTRLNVNESMVEIGTSAAGVVMTDAVSTTLVQFPFSLKGHVTMFPISVNPDKIR